MIIIVFFGGILLGFLLGFTAMALLSLTNHRVQYEELQEAPAYRQIYTRLDG